MNPVQQLHFDVLSKVIIMNRYSFMFIIILIISFTVELCPALPPIPNGVITYGPDMIADFDVGTNATHTCDPGFRLLFSEIRTCLVGGSWSGLTPVCQRTYRL